MPIDLKDISLSGASLEPIDSITTHAVRTSLGKFPAHARNKVERRQNEDRRAELRFQDNRRTNKDRRPGKAWEIGHNL